MATIRQWLVEAGFDYEKGKIVYQEASGYSPGWSSPDEMLPGRFIKWDDPILDRQFDEGYGAPRCPRFIAKDKDSLYFPGQYDGATFLVAVFFNLNKYTDKDNLVQTPYPGG